MTNETSNNTKFYGCYRGTVIAHCAYGACKIWIPGIYPEEWKYLTAEVDGREIPGAGLPTAQRAGPLFGSNVDGNGVYSYPALNSIVWCFFENGDTNFPVYFASDLSGIDAKANFERVIPKVDEANIENYQIHEIHMGNIIISFNEDGTLVIKSQNKKGAEESSIEITELGTINVSSSRQTKVISPRVDIDSKHKIFLNSKSIEARKFDGAREHQSALVRQALADGADIFGPLYPGNP